MKRVLSILLLSIFLFEIAGYFPLFTLARYQVQGDVKRLLENGLPESSLTLITVGAAELGGMDWIRKDKEFRMHGSMYDIVRTEKTADGMRFYCLDDRQEKQLFANLEEQVNRQLDNDRYPAGKSVKNFLKLFSALTCLIPGKLRFIPQSAPAPAPAAYAVCCTPVFLEIPTPPPNPAA